MGGCVRDLLLGHEPKDFDVVTNASPEQVRKAFRNCRLIGRRFRLAHVHFGRDIIEVATFRGSDNGDLNDHKVHEDGRLLSDNVFGTLEDDVWRRDFTVNSLYYNIRDFSIIDYTGGMTDLTSGVLRLIGDPMTRYREDPVRMLRAVRFSVKLGFSLDKETEAAIYEMASLLKAIPPARLFDEALKLLLAGKGLQNFEMLRHYGLFSILFPLTEKSLASEENGFPKMFVVKALENSDKRLAEGKTVTPYFLMSAFLWDSVASLAKSKTQDGDVESIAFQNAASEVLSQQAKSLSIPKRITQSMREVWLLQLRFNRRVGSKPFKLMEHPRFRAAYDFLLLRAETGEVDRELAEWWTKFQVAKESEKRKMVRPRKRYRKQKKNRNNSTNSHQVND